MTTAMNFNKGSNVIHLSDKLQDDLLNVLDELFYFSINNYGEFILEKSYDILSKMEVSKELEKRIFPQLIWWVTFCCRIGIDNKSIFQLFIDLNQHKWKRKGATFHDTLSRWQLAAPGFYIIESIGDSKRVYKLIDIFGLKQHIVGIYNDVYQQAQRGEMVTGILLPIGNDIYTTPVDFFHIPLSITPKLAWEIMLQYNKNNVSGNNHLNPQDYPSLIITALKKLEKFSVSTTL